MRVVMGEIYTAFHQMKRIYNVKTNISENVNEFSCNASPQLVILSSETSNTTLGGIISMVPITGTSGGNDDDIPDLTWSKLEQLYRKRDKLEFSQFCTSKNEIW